MPKGLQRFSALVRKEIIQLLRDRRSLAFMLGLPLLQLFLFSYAVNSTVYHIPTALVDQSRDRKSREFIDAMTNSQYFDITLQVQNQNDVIKAIDRGDVKAGVVIPPNFAAQTDRGTANVLILLDGSDSASVSSGFGSAALIAQSFSLNITSEQVIRKGIAANSGASISATSTLPITSSTRVLYNPDMISVWFILPGIVGLILQNLAVQQAALIVVKDRELGTVEQILITPTRPLELVLSKMIPLLVLCLLAMGVTLAIGVFWFQVPFQGSIFLYFWMSLLFIVGSLGLGMLISTRATTQRQAQQMALLPMLFGLLLGGLIYPRSSMPLIPQLIGNLFPLTFFIRISRSIFIKGVGLEFVWSDALVLVFYSVIIIVIAARNFKPRLD
ncbi:MAG: ABC transporter permease [Chloroflexota bacterium]